jgi:hypothetical protein
MDDHDEGTENLKLLRFSAHLTHDSPDTVPFIGLFCALYVGIIDWSQFNVHI